MRPSQPLEGRKANWLFVDAEGETHTVVPRGSLVVSEQPVGALVRLIEAGAGIAMIARTCVHEHLASGAFVALLPDHRVEGQTGRAHGWTPVTSLSRMPSSAWHT